MEARLSRECGFCGNPRLRLPGVAPRRRGELGGKRLSNSSGLSCPPKDTRFLLGAGMGRSSHLCFLLKAWPLPTEHQTDLVISVQRVV